eukprot:2446989-Pyramimonas_sp.AAC.2
MSAHLSPVRPATGRGFRPRQAPRAWLAVSKDLRRWGYVQVRPSCAPTAQRTPAARVLYRPSRGRAVVQSSPRTCGIPSGMEPRGLHPLDDLRGKYGRRRSG